MVPIPLIDSSDSCSTILVLFKLICILYTYSAILIVLIITLYFHSLFHEFLTSLPYLLETIVLSLV